MHHVSKIAAAAALLAAFTAAQAQVNFNANVELDPTSTSNLLKDKGGKNFLGGRVEVNALATLVRQGDNFVNARATLNLPVNGDKVGVDDLWLMIGNSSADLRLGRFEAVDLFPLGLDTLVLENTQVGYMANTLRGRFNDRIHPAFGSNLGAGTRFELGVIGAGSTQIADFSNTTENTVYGLRPTLTYVEGPLRLRAGIESIKDRNPTKADSTGYGLSVGYSLNNTTNLNVNYASHDKSDASSFAVNVVSGALGVGFLQEKTGKNSADTVYVAYRMPLFNMKNAIWTPAFSHVSNKSGTETTGVRVRLNFLF